MYKGAAHLWRIFRTRPRAELRAIVANGLDRPSARARVDALLSGSYDPTPEERQALEGLYQVPCSAWDQAHVDGVPGEPPELPGDGIRDLLEGRRDSAGARDLEVTLLRAVASGDAKSAMWLLERAWPSRWAVAAEEALEDARRQGAEDERQRLVAAGWRPPEGSDRLQLPLKE